MSSDRITKYLTEGKLTPIAKFQLATFAQKQGISESSANEIMVSPEGEGYSNEKPQHKVTVPVAIAFT